MKGRESGMPEERYWESFFDADKALADLASDTGANGDWIEFGCGYGTFTLAAARRTAGLVTAQDIEPAMIDLVRAKAQAQGLHNIRASVRDFLADCTGLADASQSCALIFNLLHIENPVALLREAHRTLHAGGLLAVMHWRSDIPTPRGPPLAIRPVPAQCEEWIRTAGFIDARHVDLRGSCPYHFGMIAARSE